MPADHINIQHPEKRGVESDYYRQRLLLTKTKAELEQLTQWYLQLQSDLEAIFNRIERGDRAELHYPDGRVFVITGKAQGENNE
jgi:hypothetical protein